MSAFVAKRGSGVGGGSGRRAQNDDGAPQAGSRVWRSMPSSSNRHALADAPLCGTTASTHKVQALQGRAARLPTLAQHVPPPPKACMPTWLSMSSSSASRSSMPSVMYLITVCWLVQSSKRMA